MTEESKQANNGGTVRSFFRENPTLLLSLMCVDLTGIGILYSLIFYRQFGINIFDFAEIGDFLLAAFKAPGVTFSVLLAQVGLLGLLVWVRRFLWREGGTQPQRTEEPGTPRIHDSTRKILELQRTRVAIVVLTVGTLVFFITTNERTGQEMKRLTLLLAAMGMALLLSAIRFQREYRITERDLKDFLERRRTRPE